MWTEFIARHSFGIAILLMLLVLGYRFIAKPIINEGKPVDYYNKQDNEGDSDIVESGSSDWMLPTEPLGSLEPI